VKDTPELTMYPILSLEGDKDIDTHVGQRIRRRRRALGMTQSNLAEAIGVRFQQVQKYETGANRVSASKMFLIAEVLQTDLIWFWTGLPSRYALADTPDAMSAATEREAQMLTAFRACHGATQASLLEITRAAGKDG
jgi:transcriptional regulator with XRE-family HTH domain